MVSMKETLIMAQVLVAFRMDAEDKKGMEDVCKELGMSMSTAFTIFAKKMRRERRIPFEGLVNNVSVPHIVKRACLSNDSVFQDVYA